MVHVDELLTRKAWAQARRRGADGPRVLIATSMGGFNHGVVTEKALAIALTLRGAAVELYLCDGMPACQLTKVGAEPPESLIETDRRVRCPSCIAAGQGALGPLQLPVHRLSGLLDPASRAEAGAIAAQADIADLKSLTLDGWRIGEHALAGALRYFARGDFEAEPLGDGVARSFLRSAVLTARGINRLLTERQYDVACFNHGIYVPQGVIGEVARSRGVRVVNWNPAYRRHCFIFSHDDSYHHTMISENASAWEAIELTPERREKTTNYLRARREAKDDWIWFNDAADTPRDELYRTLALDDRPLVIALTSVVWDARLHYESNAFDSLKDWMLDTVAYFAKRPDLQLVVRVHPAEVTGFVPSRDKMADALAAAFSTLPDNVRVVPPESPLSTYSLLDHANAALVYSTKTGIEASAAGLPVVVAGEAWVRGKGFTEDAASPASYRAILDRLPFSGRLEPRLRDRALRYAYHFFFRRMIELPFLVDAGKTKFDIDVEALEDLGPGRSSGLDCVCDGILKGTPFVQHADEESRSS